MTIPHSGWVAPFGYPRINACSRLPVAFRSVPRPSSPPGAKASTECPSRARDPTAPQGSSTLGPTMHRNHPQRPSVIVAAVSSQRPRPASAPPPRRSCTRITLAQHTTLASEPSSRPLAGRQNRPVRQSQPRTRPETHQNLIHSDKEHARPSGNAPRGRHRRRPTCPDSTIAPNSRLPCDTANSPATACNSSDQPCRSTAPDMPTSPTWWRRSDRTDDPLLAKQVLSQLSYAPNSSSARSSQIGLRCDQHDAALVGQGGFEPPTPRLSSVCSNQLSY